MNGVLSFFERLKNNGIIEYTILEKQAYYSVRRWDRRAEMETGEPIDPYRDTVSPYGIRVKLFDLLNSYPTGGYATSVTYKSKMENIKIFWQGIPVKEDTPITFSFYWSTGSMRFTNSNTNGIYFDSPRMFYRGLSRTLTIGALS